jgi:hypothetical protein
VPAYIESCSQGRPPIALHMAFTPAMSQFFWLYWRLYDTYIPKKRFAETFSDAGSARKAERLLALIRRLRLCDSTEEGFRLNERGAFWLHLLQNHFALNYVNTIWTAAKFQPWPEVIRF